MSDINENEHVALLGSELSKNLDAIKDLDAEVLPKPLGPVVITVSNQKGGVGKTTSAVNLAAALSLGGLSVLVIDVDPQGNASTALGVDHSPGTVSSYDVLLGDLEIEDVVQVCPDFPAILVCPATIDLAGAEIELASAMGREFLLQRALDRFLAAYGSIDVVLIDCPPSLGLLTINALVAAKHVLIPVQSEYYALEGLSLLIGTIDRVRDNLNPDLSVMALLLTMMDGRTKLSAEVAEEVRRHFPGETLDAEVPRSVRVSEAPSYGQTVIAYEPRGTGTVAYREAARELAERWRVNA